MPADTAAAAASPRARIRIKPQRGVPEEAAAILAAGLVAHVGFTDPEGGQPFVIPMTYHYDPADPARLHLHGAHHSRLMALLAEGAPVCVTVTLLDGIVYSRTALYHSVNYRSVCAYARAAAEQPGREEQRVLLERMITRYIPGRIAGREYQHTPDAHVDATAFVALEIEEMSAKARRGGPMGPTDDDPQAPGTCGVLPLREF